MKTQLRNYRKLLGASSSATVSFASVLLVILSSMSFRLHTSKFDLDFNQQITPAELAEIVSEHEHHDR